MRATHRPRRVSTASLFALAALGASCGPVQSSTLIVDAQAELAAAQTAGAEKQAPFEYVAAEEYLHKAREEQSYSDFEVSVRFAKKAKDCARAARQIAEQTTRAGMGIEETATKTARCRPGPERENGAPDPSEEPAARGIVTQPPKTPAKAVPAKKPAVQQPPAQQPAQRNVVVPKDEKKKDEPLPEGDDEPKDPE